MKITYNYINLWLDVFIVWGANYNNEDDYRSLLLPRRWIRNQMVWSSSLLNKRNKVRRLSGSLAWKPIIQPSLPWLSWYPSCTIYLFDHKHSMRINAIKLYSLRITLYENNKHLSPVHDPQKKWRIKSINLNKKVKFHKF